MNFRFLIFMIFIVPLIILSCKEKIIETKSASFYEQDGVFIINEGIFNSGTGTIDFFNTEKDSLVKSIFQSKNKFPLGNIVQSAYSMDKKYMYIVVNNANKIEIVKQNDFESLNRLENIHLPRYIQSVSNKLYISAWDNSVKVYALGDTVHPTFIKSIAAGIGPERIIAMSEKIFVLNQGGLSIDSTITVIDTETDEVIHTMSVYPKPTGAVIDKNNKLWVMCSGKGWNGIVQEDDSQAHLLCLDPVSYEVISDFSFPDMQMHPIGLIMDDIGKTLYYTYPSGIMSQDISFNSLQMNIIYSTENAMYGLAFDSKNKEILASNPLSYNEKGIVYRLSKEGVLLSSFEGGIIPGNFLINE